MEQSWVNPIQRFLLAISTVFLLGVYSTSFAVTGAVYTTFDATQGGCLDNPNGVNCNNYVSKPDVYITGGPAPGGSGLGDGDYYFTVIAPGYQNGGFIDGAMGNLSDTTVGGTVGDAGSGDLIPNRTFHITAGNITSYAGDHASAIPGSSNYDPDLVSLQGKLLIQLIPYDDTDNPGGVYILAICKVGATTPSDCKYDAFRIHQGPPNEEPPKISGLKYYDVNTNGAYDVGEVGIENWPIPYMDSSLNIFNILTVADGTFTVTVSPDTYQFAEIPGAAPWMQTGNLVNQSTIVGTATVVLNVDKSYTITVSNNDVVTGINFGNVCVGAGGGKTLGFWSNKNGQALFGADDLALMVSLNLRNGNGTHFDPANYPAFRTWLLNATATNMAYMTSAQLAAMALNVNNGLVNGGSLIYAPGTGSANVNGFATVNDIMAEANALLGTNGLVLAGDPVRTLMEALKNALDNGNNNLNFVQPSPANCPPPPTF